MQLPRTLSAVTADRLSKILWAVTAAVCAFFSVRLFMGIRADSQDSWYAMTQALDFMRYSAPGEVYETLLFSHHIKFQYPPSGLFLLEFLHWLGVDSTAKYNLINAVAMLVTGMVLAVFTRQVLGEIRTFGVRLPLGLFAYAAALKYFPSRFAFELGQIQVLLGLFFILACLAMWHGKRLAAGVLIAATASVKPQLLVFGVWALWRRDWRFIAGFAALALVGTVLAIGMYGWDAQIQYLKVLQFLSHHGECYHTNESINGILNRLLMDVPCIDSDPNADPDSPVLSSWFPPYIPAVYVATVVTSLIMIAIPFVLRAKGTDPPAMLLNFCTAAILFTMASPIAWVHHYNILLPAYVVGVKVALDCWQGRRARIAMLLFGASFILTGFRVTSPFGPTVPAHNLIQSHVFVGACLLVGLLLAEMRAYSPKA